MINYKDPENRAQTPYIGVRGGTLKVFPIFADREGSLLNQFLVLEMNILVIDDVTAARRVLKRLLASLGHAKVDEAVSGQDALEKLKIIEKPDLIITDLHLKDMLGVDLLNVVRSEEKFKTIPSIIVTSDGDRQEVFRALKSGVSGYMLKPFNAASLKAKIDEILNPELPEAKAYDVLDE